MALQCHQIPLPHGPIYPATTAMGFPDWLMRLSRATRNESLSSDQDFRTRIE